ncbi:MAG: hypothetical protein ACKOCC_08830 [Actinomycetota bacterium]
MNEQVGAPSAGATPKKDDRECMSCGAPYATSWSTPEGTAWLCRECATLHGLGCP